MQRTALQIADQAAFLGVRVSAGSGWEQSTISLHAPTAQLDSAMALFADIALHPTFPAADRDIVKPLQKRIDPGDDHGVGLPRHLWPQVFQPFQSFGDRRAGVRVGRARDRVEGLCGQDPAVGRGADGAAGPG